jgi:hypothetical protein
MQLLDTTALISALTAWHCQVYSARIMQPQLLCYFDGYQRSQYDFKTINNNSASASTLQGVGYVHRSSKMFTSLWLHASLYLAKANSARNLGLDSFNAPAAPGAVISIFFA